LIREIAGIATANDSYEILVARDANSRKAVEARGKILAALAQGPAGFTELWKRAHVSSSTLQEWLPKLLDQQRVMSEGKRYHLNEQVPIPLEAVAVSLGRKPAGEPFPLVHLRRGRPELTEMGETLVTRKLREATEHKLGRHVGIDEILNRTLWAGLRSLSVVELVNVEPVPRDPVTGQRLRKGAGNCPSCHTGMMKEIHPSSYWHCQNCGINRGGSFNPLPVA
jgi:transposase-like protein